ncbi:hypothetical protein [Hymenobacter nivis]|uniref:hypothetical protein n=1 Tax=Hymenobacter nivis TaxID=1850093 RepID=UPI0013A56BDA|nr:hypothetical protein [Hymenobacter nivis]
MVFALSGAQARAQTETVAPYALFGDTNGSHVPWTPALGAYKLTATPYAGPSGTGGAGIPLTVSFSIVATPAARGGAPAVAAAVVYPNPSGDGRVVVALPEAFAGEVTYALVSAMGARVATGTFACPGPGGTQALDFSGHMPAAGVYNLYLTGGQAQAHLKLLRR